MTILSSGTALPVMFWALRRIRMPEQAQSADAD